MLYIATVLYNKRICDIASLETVLSFIETVGNDNAQLIIVDNSDKIEINADDEKDMIHKNIVYIRNGGNLGLSKAYNKAFQYSLKRSIVPENEYILFIDDDTPLSYEYFNSIYSEVNDLKRKEDGVNVITGIISSGGKAMSPTKGFRFMFRDKDYITEPGVYDDISCISSGMAVRLSALKEICGFEERLFLDMIDYTMLFRLSKIGICKVLVIDNRAVQNFSGRDEKDKKALLRRFEIYKKDFTTYCKITGKGTIYRFLHLLKRRISIG